MSILNIFRKPVTYLDAWGYLITSTGERRTIRRRKWKRDVFVSTMLEKTLKEEPAKTVLVIVKQFGDKQRTFKWFPSYDDIQAKDWELNIHQPQIEGETNVTSTT